MTREGIRRLEAEVAEKLSIEAEGWRFDHFHPCGSGSLVTSSAFATRAHAQDATRGLDVSGDVYRSYPRLSEPEPFDLAVEALAKEDMGIQVYGPAGTDPAIAYVVQNDGHQVSDGEASAWRLAVLQAIREADL